MASVSAELVDDGQLQLKLSEAIAKIEHPEKLLKEVANFVAARTKRRFETSGFGAWKPIQFETRYRRSGDVNAPPLHDTGALELAAIATEEGVQYSLYSIEGDQLTIGVARADVSVHQFGSDPGRGFKNSSSKGEPARPFLPVDEEDELELEEAIMNEEFLDKYLMEAFGNG